ncbi:hypothetical protein [Arcanobacterium buesumense]|uniref:Uncharacterized protein n=1 Tax=Arcanobacterium buesumense TaxID=2722751 RepID=A0A6H2EHX3_9ACTO|nr:hypothetical protein [Arcanobacterium buesumense]QJC21165.1 hypothetical protein HC352_00600 [Arcanobacterium buesumense]
MSGTDLILQMSRAALPANRNIDIARRISAATMMGFLFGAVVGMLLFIDEVPVERMFFVLIPAVILGVVVYLCWRIWQPPLIEPTPVVARVLGTTESNYIREVRSGGHRGILVPVVAMPVDGGTPFRSMVTVQAQRGHDVVEPPAGTLLSLFQTEPGIGELINGEETAEQRALIEKLTKRPRILSNRAEILPIRRGPLERTPRTAAIQWWASAGIATFAAMLFVGSLRG